LVCSAPAVTPSTPAPPATSANSPTANASPTLRLPVPADGADPRSCADGTCEIRVRGPVTVPLPARFGVGPLKVTAIKAQTVNMVIALRQSEFSSDGGCSAIITGPAPNAGGHVDLTCHANEKTVVNKMKLEVEGIADKAAIIRIRPAT
jgi:hypothetical protein